jgi:cell division protein FtsW (lipid II flippase)
LESGYYISFQFYLNTWQKDFFLLFLHSFLAFYFLSLHDLFGTIFTWFWENKRWLQFYISNSDPSVFCKVLNICGFSMKVTKASVVAQIYFLLSITLLPLILVTCKLQHWWFIEYELWC